jgi:hypothetical protein
MSALPRRAILSGPGVRKSTNRFGRLKPYSLGASRRAVRRGRSAHQLAQRSRVPASRASRSWTSGPGNTRWPYGVPHGEGHGTFTAPRPPGWTRQWSVVTVLAWSAHRHRPKRRGTAELLRLLGLSCAVSKVDARPWASSGRPLPQSLKGGCSPSNIGKCRTFNVASSQPSTSAVPATK